MENDHSVFLGLGSNTEDASDRLDAAVAAVGGMRGVTVRAVSAEYETEPQGFRDQPWFKNRVMALAVAPDWQPAALMRALLGLEARLGRVRSPDPALRYGPRAIDIDILLFDDVAMDDPACTLPHPRMRERAFILVPLLDLAPDIVIGGVPARDLLGRLTWRLEGRKIFQ